MEAAVLWSMKPRVMKCWSDSEKGEGNDDLLQKGYLSQMELKITVPPTGLVDESGALTGLPDSVTKSKLP